jgi:CubicO group peptidase (beta-lactamase class C family)
MNRSDSRGTTLHTISLTALASTLASVTLLWLGMVADSSQAQSSDLDASLIERIDAFVETERQGSGIPGIALAILTDGRPTHIRGFGHDGHGRPITGDTPFPIGSLTKSFTALMVRQAIDAGRLDADAPVQRYLPWFRVADVKSSGVITLRHLLNQTSGFSRADGIAPLLRGSTSTIEELAHELRAVFLNRPVGERFEYSNLNFVLLGAVLEAVMGRSWQDLVQSEVLRPLAMSHSYTDHYDARQAGMTAVHRMWFEMPVAQNLSLLPGFAPTGSLVASANDMAAYLRMLLAGGVSANGQVVSAQGVRQLLAASSPSSHANLLSTEFQFRYGEGWFVGPFGAAVDARWHLGSLASFAAWMVLLPDTKKAVIMLINANTELPFGEVNAVMSRLPIGVVNQLLGQPVMQGPSLHRAYLRLIGAAAFAVIGLALLAWRVTRLRWAWWSLLMMLLAIAMIIVLLQMGLNFAVLSAFAPDLTVVLGVILGLLCLPSSVLVLAWVRRSYLHKNPADKR